MATKVHFLSADELAQLLASVIAGVAGGTAGRWRKLIGPVEQLPTWCNVRCNWRIEPRGTEAQREVIEQAAAVVKVGHPYVD